APVVSQASGMEKLIKAGPLIWLKAKQAQSMQAQPVGVT
ncbi:hypothetical protein A2U01_0082609, partial [Trifolium medium]|nr:hypothetical protein [Trifolium medium]